jgi:iron complex outermembrane recepter protein
MIKNTLFTLLLSVCAICVSAQLVVKGTVKDASTGEVLIGVNVVYGPGQGVVTNINGEFIFLVEPGKKIIEANYVGYESSKRAYDFSSKETIVDFLLEPREMTEVEVIADVAIDRKTPVAFTDIPAIKIREELGARDFPMILNATPGVYATQSGGGDGDARVNIRGFDQRNIAVMVDGIPMNDMENGWVYWSNWFGLDAVTQKTQVQRGLGASKLAVPAVGGNINILSQGIENKLSVKITTEIGNNGNRRQGVGFNTGRMKGNIGFTGAVSYRQNDGWVTNLGSSQLFYFFKAQKEFGKQSLSLSIMGSPQQHEQRVARQRASFYDLNYALNQGMDTTGFAAAQVPTDLGLRFNAEWGYLRRDRDDDEAEITRQSARTNYYHKPIVNVKHFWAPNSRLAVSNILYASFGNGGGTRANTPITDVQSNLTDFQFMYDKNTKTSFTNLGIELNPFDLNYVDDSSQFKSSYYLQSSINNHRWFGALSTVRYKVNEEIELSGGFDGRVYKVNNFQEVYDLLGGDYVVVDRFFQDANIAEEEGQAQVVRGLGDRINYNISTWVRQTGVFFLGEYSKPRFSAFVNLTLSSHDYKRRNHWADANSPNLVESDWINFIGYTAKGGFKYLPAKNHSIFVNAGFLSRAPNVLNTFSGRSLNVFNGLVNEKVTSFELGYTYNDKVIRPTINAYYTIWGNRPITGTRTNGTEVVFFNITGLEAVHRGVEFELDYKVAKSLNLETIVSLGDWQWNSAAESVITDELGIEVLDVVQFDARGVKVGDAAQTQVSGAVRWEPIKNLYFKPRITYFDDYYAQFNPESLRGEFGGRQSWKIPAYTMIDLGFGYNFDLKKRYNLGIRGNILNLADAVFITDAFNNEYGSDFDINSAGVYFGMGRRWNLALVLSFK